MKKTQYLLESGTLSLLVDAQCGGRVTEFACDGRNALAETGPQIGSTFWPSPQEAWGWPPPAVLDSEPYTISESPGGLTLSSAPCEQTHLQLTKVFELSERSARIRYVMCNVGNAARRWAPWEITRIYGGLTFYGADQPVLNISSGEAVFDGHHVWHQYRPKQQSDHQKLFGNGSQGWLANAHNGLLLVKKFVSIAEVANIAPGEAEVEIYAHGDAKNAYIEIEQQGCYGVMAPGESQEWEVEWFLAPLDKGPLYEIGDAALVRQVERLIEA